MENSVIALLGSEVQDSVKSRYDALILAIVKEKEKIAFLGQNEGVGSYGRCARYL